MKYLLKIFIFSSLLISTTLSRAQATGAQFVIIFNSNTILFDCFLNIAEGNACSDCGCLQFTAQYSFINPNGIKVEISSTDLLPIDNKELLDIQSRHWTISSKQLTLNKLLEFDLNQVSLNNNEFDFKSHELKMQNGDFSNGFTMESYDQFFKVKNRINQVGTNYTLTWSNIKNNWV